MFKNLNEYRDYFRKGFQQIKSISVRTMPETLDGFVPRYAGMSLTNLIRESNAYHELYNSPRVVLNSFSCLIIDVIGKNKYKILYFEYDPYQLERPDITDESQAEYKMIATLVNPDFELFKFDFFSDKCKESFLGYCYFKGILHSVNLINDFAYIVD